MEQEQKRWHSLSADEVLEKLGVDVRGLSPEQAQRRRGESGPNQLREEKGKSVFAYIIGQFKSPLIYLLVLAAGVSLLAGKVIDAGVIVVVVILNTALGVGQEWRAEKALEALKQLSSPHARVLRNGKTQDVKAADVVPGDILILKRGDRVGADARLLKVSDLHVDESALTGESEPVAKNTDPVKPDASQGDRLDMVFMSTLVTHGSGQAVVVETGMDTAMGRIAGEVRQTEREETPLQKRMGKLSVYIGILALSLAAVVFFLGLFRDYGFIDMLLFSVAVAVSAIPEGLPAVISVTLALGVQRMAQRNAVIRRLPAVETLGSTTVICSDKTGTITKNEMTVTRIWAGGKFFKVTGEGYAPEGEIKPESEADPESAALNRLQMIGVLNNDAEVSEEDGNWRIEGTPTEGSLLVAAKKAGLDYKQEQGKYLRQADIPFSSEQKYMASLNEFPEKTSGMLLVKGAPDRILEFCDRVMENNRIEKLDQKRRQLIEEVNDALARDGLRVLAGAWRDFDAKQSKISSGDAENNLVLCGLWGIMDPPRPEAVRAIEETKKAGIRVVMVTGDHASTAEAIAKKAGIDPGRQGVLSGQEIDRLSDEEFDERIKGTNVLARVSPSHKLRLMNALQKQGQVVAMTGDGVNDAPSLKGSNIGVAMGQAGTQVAREAADMVLTDDNFATIVAAVEEGRVIFDNLRRVVFFLITTNVGEVITLVAVLIIGWPLPLTAVMILWINLLTDGASTVPLGVEPMHQDVLELPPRSPKEGIVNKVTLRRILLLAPVMAGGTLVVYGQYLDHGQPYAQTMAFTTLAAFQWFQALNARSQYESVVKIGIFSNKWLSAGLGAAILLQLLTVYSSAGRTLFGTVGISFLDWGIAILAASFILIVEEVLKFFGVHGKLRGKTQG